MSGPVAESCCSLPARERAPGTTLGAWRETRAGTIFVSAGIRRTLGDERLFLFLKLGANGSSPRGLA